MKLKNIFGKHGQNRVLEQSSLLVIGVIIGVLITEGTSLEMDTSFSIVDFITLLVAVVLTFYLQHALTARADDDRVEKDLVIETLKRVSQELDAISATCSASASGDAQAGDAKAILGQFRTLSNELHKLESLLDLTPIRLEMERFRQIKKASFELKTITTGGSFPSAQLSSCENTKIQSAVRTLQTACIRFTFYVNRL